MRRVFEAKYREWPPFRPRTFTGEAAMTDLETLATAIHPLWDQAKGIEKYDQQAWVDYHCTLVFVTTELARLRIELARYHQVRNIIQEIVCDYGEEVPRGTG